MAKPYGGKYSPGGARGPATTGSVPRVAPRRDRATVDPVGARANMMFVPPVILLFTSLAGGPVVLATGLVGAAVMALAAWLLRGGLRAEAAYDARPIASRPALPRKLLAAVLTGFGVAAATATGDSGLLGSLIYGTVAGIAHVVAFGSDPLRNKRLAGVDDFQQDRVARVVAEAEAHLTAMTRHAGRLQDRPLQLRITAFQDIARRMIHRLEEDPRDLTAARKFLSVYLEGARDATAKYADLSERTPSPEARSAYLGLLDDLDQNFAARTDSLLRDDRSDMDIEIKVLRDRLAREGIADNRTDNG